MSSANKTRLVFLVLVLLLIGLVYGSSFIIEDNKKIKTNIINAVRMDMARAYAEGQRDYAEGDIRYDVKNECWLKSPCNCGETYGVRM